MSYWVEELHKYYLKFNMIEERGNSSEVMSSEGEEG